MPQRQRPTVDRDELEEGLRIDEDNLDACLVNQAELFFQVAKNATEANAQRDELKLQLKELMAELDGSVRKNLIENEEKFTETSLANRILTLPRVRDMQRAVLNATKLAEQWQNLKESYQARGYSLRELNSSQIARYYNLGTERGASSARQRIGERAQEEDRGRRVERFRSRNREGE